jgi:hypothetical protein
MENEITTRLDLLNPEYKKFVLGSFIDEVSKVLSTEVGFTEDQELVFHNGISLFLLLFLNVEEFISFIETECEIPSAKASGLAGAVFASLPDGMLDLQNQTYVEITNVETNSPNTPELEISSFTQEDLLSNQ